MSAGDSLRGSPRLVSSLYGAVGLLVAVYAVVGIWVVPAMFSDSSVGFLASDSMSRGGPFNHIVEPDARDIARDRSWFVALWSPGQYALPHLFELIGLSLGTSLIVVTTLFTVLGLLGWHLLYRSWGFAPLPVAVAVALMAGSRTIALPFGIFNGGEVLLFGSAPWFLLLLHRWSALTVFQAVGLLVASAVLMFMKLSSLVLVYASLAATAVYDLWPPASLWPPTPARLRRPLMAAAIGAAFAVGFYVLWLSQGITVATMASAGWALLDLPYRFVQGAGTTVFGMLAAGDLARRILHHPPNTVLATLETFYLVVGIPSLVLIAFVGRRLMSTHRDYVRFMLATAFFYVLIMTLIYLRNTGGIFMEDRYFRPLSFILLIGVVQAVMTAGWALRIPFAAVAALLVVYSVTSYFVRADANLRAPLGARGLRHQILSHDGLALIRKELAGPFDRADTIVWVISPEIALELPHVRVIASGDEPRDLAWRSYKGRVGKMFVLVPATMVADGRAATILRALKDYDPGRWTTKSLGDYTLYSQ